MSAEKKDEISNEKQNEISNEKQNSSWSVEKVSAILTGILPIVTMYLDNKKNDNKTDTEYLRITTKHDQKVIIALLSFLGVIMGALVWLTATDKIGGESLLFAVGLTIGYIFALIQKFIFGSQRTVSNEE